jgi:predicted RNase H-like nuclease
MNATTVIGVDCATDPRRVGLALARAGSRTTRVLQVVDGGEAESPAACIARWMADADRVLLAMDAPLGWPVALGRRLATHRAGEPFAEDPNEVFRRGTDRFVRWTVGKQPLDVGADRIARTAHAALGLIEEVRVLARARIPLAWSPDFKEPAAAIEVYPAATLAVHGLPASGYKTAEQRDRRNVILRGLKERLVLPEDVKPLRANADRLDAVVCVLAGLDFLTGAAMAPEDLDTARREGWIWVRRPG